DMDDLGAEIGTCISEDDTSVDDEPRRTPKETGFHRSARECLRKIREDLLQHRWQEAAEYMISYFQTLEDTTVTKQLLASEIIWRLGTEILHHHPNSNPEDFNSFLEQMKNIGVKSYLKVSLEHAFHLLLTGHFDEAKQQLSIAESWRYGRQSASQADKMKLIHAYRGFLDYFSWISKKNATSGDDDADVADHKEMHNYFRQASVNLQEILKQPGVWDPFVIGYVNMLEFYNDQDGALSILKEYAYDNSFPPNPNAHVFLYDFLKRHDAPEKKLIRVLEVLQALVPSHELMLELCSLLLKSEN
ncbi:TATA box-binding protein-associated factor RNA polymerase I subunit A-like, partial [Scleropages formosus]